MTNYKRKIAIAISTGALLLNSLAPLAFADTTIEISGNGADSNSTANVSTNRTTMVVQSNTANVTNNVTSNASTGGNEANRNTGGNVTIDTGNANSTANVSTKVNVNSADVNNCGACAGGNTTVNISGNGADSDNNANVNTTSETGVFQNNRADVDNNVTAKSSTGYNEAERNTGGNVEISTGNATTNVTVNTAANANIANVGGGSGSGAGVDARIVGNGADSDNTINLTVDRPVTIRQNNDAYIDNDVYASAKTGGNEAEDNTGGNVTIDTGNASTKVNVDNMANFNAADVDCGCLLGNVLAKISGNGADSDNTIKARLSGDVSVFQGDERGNNADINNDIYAKAKTGHNEAEDNTGPVSEDPLDIMTGDASSNTSVSNSANANVFGPLGDLHLPSGVSFDFNFNLGDLLGSIHLG